MYIKIIKLRLQNVNIKLLIQNLYYVCQKNEYLIFDIKKLIKKLIQLIRVKSWNPVAIKKIDP